MTTHLYNFVKAQAQLAAQAARRAEALRVAQADGGIFAGPADRTKTEAMLEAGRPAAAAAASRAVAPSTKRPRSVERVDGDSDEIEPAITESATFDTTREINREDSPQGAAGAVEKMDLAGDGDGLEEMAAEEMDREQLRLEVMRLKGCGAEDLQGRSLVQLRQLLNTQRRRVAKRTRRPRRPIRADWSAQLVRLVAYKDVHGDCNVPRDWAEDPRLAKWVDTQRTAARTNKGMTAARAAALTALGFAWKQQPAQWEVMLARLTAYQAVNGNCDVPKTYAVDQRLGTWVQNQKQRKKNMPEERAAKLRSLGFF